jgi:hypothetical protein
LNIRLSQEQKLFCQALSADHEIAQTAAQAWMERAGDERAFAFAKTNQVAPLAAHALAGEGGFDDLPAHWAEAHNETQQRVGAYLRELDRIAGMLAGQGIRLVALKNGGIARGIYPCAGCCPMGDLDALVEERNFRKTHDLLVDDGYRLAFKPPSTLPSIEAAEANGVAEYDKELENGEKLWFELHSRPVTGRWIRPDQEPKAEELLERSLPIPGSAARLLAPEDNLLQVALHTARHSYVRAPGFRLHTDVERIVRRQAIDWEVFLRQASNLQVKTAVYFSLAIPRLLFETPIPQEVLRRLRPAGWKENWIAAWLERAGLFYPDERKFGRAGYVAFTALLYDDAGGLWKAAFPERAYMRQRYAMRSDLLLPYYHLKRLADLALRRVST